MKEGDLPTKLHTMRFRGDLRDAIRKGRETAALAFAKAQVQESSDRATYLITTGHERPWLSYRRDADNYFGDGYAEFPLWLKKRVLERIEEAHANGKKSVYADVAGEARGKQFSETVTFSITADKRKKEPGLTPVEGSLFIPEHRKRFRDAVRGAGGELIFVSVCMVGGGIYGGADSLIRKSESADLTAYGLKQLKDFFTMTYNELAPGGYIGIVGHDIVGKKHDVRFGQWLEKKGYSFARVPNAKDDFVSTIVAKPPRENTGRKNAS